MPSIRRFDRERYDAQAVVGAFTGRLRRTIDLDTVSGRSGRRRL